MVSSESTTEVALDVGMGEVPDKLSQTVTVEAIGASKVSSSKRRLLRRTFVAVLCCIAYFGTGCAFYMNVEKWSVWRTLYFLMVTASTVGYGDMNPTPGWAGSQTFTIFCRSRTIDRTLLHAFAAVAVIYGKMPITTHTAPSF